MIAVIQRTANASVTVEGEMISKISTGLLIFLGIGYDDSIEDIEWLSNKIANLRIFNDKNGVMNQSLLDVHGEAIVVSQFTLMASTKKGNRPSYINAAKPEIAIPIYKKFIHHFENIIQKKVGTGIFGADMQVNLLNDGPVTITIDTKNK